MATKVSEAALYKKLVTLGHFHFCSDRSCRQRYDCGKPGFKLICDTRRNGRCHACRGAVVPVWQHARDPRPCCRDNVVQVTNRDVLLAYRLAGPGPWFQCKTCAQASAWPRGYKPTTEGETNG